MGLSGPETYRYSMLAKYNAFTVCCDHRACGVSRLETPTKRLGVAKTNMTDDKFSFVDQFSTSSWLSVVVGFEVVRLVTG